MQEVAKIMKEYFEAEGKSSVDVVEKQLFSHRLLSEQNLPIEPAKIEWVVKEDPERFSRQFQFEERPRLIDFVNEVMRFEDEIKHHCELKVNYDLVAINVYTHNLDRITELDREFVQQVNKIYEDVLHYGYEDQGSW